MRAVFDTAKVIVDGETAFLCLAVPFREAKTFTANMKQGKKYAAEIKEHRERRSLDANAYCWVLMDKLSEVLGKPKTEIYRSYIREIGGNSETVCVVNSAVDKLREGWEHNGLGWQTDTLPSKIDGCTNVVLYYGSSTYDTAQMSRLIDMILQDCREQHIETLPPHKLDAMMEEWG